MTTPHPTPDPYRCECLHACAAGRNFVWHKRLASDVRPAKCPNCWRRDWDTPPKPKQRAEAR